MEPCNPFAAGSIIFTCFALVYYLLFGFSFHYMIKCSDAVSEGELKGPIINEPIDVNEVSSERKKV